MAHWTRRELLARAALGAGAALVSRCSGGGGAGRDLSAEIARYDPALACTDTSRLWPAEAATRKTNAYVDRSPHPDRFCFLCKNFVAPPDPRACGTCTTVKGPIHPLGWCQSWTEKR